MRFGFSVPRVLGVRPFVSFGPEDLKRLTSSRGSAGRTTGDFVYVVTNGSGAVKIGVSDNPTARLDGLQTGSHVPLRFEWVCAVRGNGYAVELAAHTLLERHRVSGEWFAVQPAMAIAAITTAAHQVNDAVVPIPLDRIDEVVYRAKQLTHSSKKSVAMTFARFSWFCVKLSISVPLVAVLFLCLWVLLQILVG